MFWYLHIIKQLKVSKNNNNIFVEDHTTVSVNLDQFTKIILHNYIPLCFRGLNLSFQASKDPF